MKKLIFGLVFAALIAALGVICSPRARRQRRAGAVRSPNRRRQHRKPDAWVLRPRPAVLHHHDRPRRIAVARPAQRRWKLVSGCFPGWKRLSSRA